MWTVLASSGTVTVIMYSPIPINISKLGFLNNAYTAGYPITGGTLYCSDNNSDYTQIGTFTNSNQTSGSTWYKSFEHSNYCYYYKMVLNTTASYICFSESYITATYISTELNTIVYPYAHSNTNYAYSLAYLNGIFGYSYAKTLTTTGMTLQNNSNADDVSYITIGY